MQTATGRRALITATGSYAPARELPNSYFNELLGEDVDTWLRQNVNIESRRWCADDESVADLCEKAARQALDRAGVRADELDLLIVATDTPEYVSPSTAAVLQHRLGATGAGTFDLNAACAGFVTALDVAAKYIASDTRYNRVLVIGGKPADLALARIPSQGETRGNLAAGGRGVPVPLSPRMRQIADIVAPTLLDRGLDFVGLDIIGDSLTEINVTSPTCVRELDAHAQDRAVTDIDADRPYVRGLADDYLDVLERRLAERRAAA